MTNYFSKSRSVYFHEMMSVTTWLEVKICRPHRTFIHRTLEILTHNLMQRVNSPHKRLVNVPSYVLFQRTRQKCFQKLRRWYSERNNSQLWHMQTVDKGILNLNLAHNVQVLTIKQQSLAKDYLSIGFGSFGSFISTAKIRLQ